MNCIVPIKAIHRSLLFDGARFKSYLIPTLNKTSPSKFTRVTPLALQTEASQFEAFASQQSNYELCAVPKKRVSLHVRRVRHEGQWQAKVRTLYKPYRICLNCGQPVMPHFICKRDHKCATTPRI